MEIPSSLTESRSIREPGLMLMLLKVVHTFIWLIMTTANFVGFYLAFIGAFNFWFFAAVILIAGKNFDGAPRSSQCC